MANTRKRIAIFFRIENEPYLMPVLRGVLDYAKATDQWSVHVDILDDTSLGDLRQRGADGVLANLFDQSSAFTEAFLRAGAPVVDIYPGGLGGPFPRVLPDDQAVGRQVAGEFLRRGFRHFAFCGAPVAEYSRNRIAGFTAVARDAGHPVHEYRPQEPWWNSIRNAAEREHLVQWLRDLPTPVGIFACADQYGRHILSCCRDAGIAVPERAAVIGVDNIENLCETLEPPLSSVPLDARRTGFEAAALLDRLMDGATPPTEPLLIPPLPTVIRRSSDIFAVADADLAAALRFIWQHAGEPITIDDLLKECPMSRRSLERRFREALGRGPMDEIWRSHVEKARALLLETNWSMQRIARRSGFASPKAFSTVFRRETGSTPSRYRADMRGGTAERGL